MWPCSRKSFPPRMSGTGGRPSSTRLKYDGQHWGSAVLARSGRWRTLSERNHDHRWLADLRGSVVVVEPTEPGLPALASFHSLDRALAPERVVEVVAAGQVPLCDPPRVWEIDLIGWELGRLFGDKSFIAGGDLNSSLLFDTNDGGTTNRRLFENLAAAGLHDLRREADEVRTYFKPGHAGYQLDHVYGDARTADRVRTWTAVADIVDGDEPLSDHAPLVVEIEEG